VTQPNVSEMEQPGRDLKLSSIKRYVEASGGKLRLDVVLPSGTHYGFLSNSMRPALGLMLYIQLKGELMQGSSDKAWEPTRQDPWTRHEWVCL